MGLVTGSGSDTEILCNDVFISDGHVQSSDHAGLYLTPTVLFSSCLPFYREGYIEGVRIQLSYI